MVPSTARKNLEAHSEAERRRDLDAIMVPLPDHPRYVIQNTILDGRDAVCGCTNARSTIPQ